MTNRIVRAAALSAVLMVPAHLGGQNASRSVVSRSAAPAVPAGARDWATELQRLQTRLQAAHNRVMQDASLRSAQESLMRDVKVAMLRIDPGLDALAQRVQGMQRDAAVAEQRGDTRRLQQLNGELGPIQQRFMRAQQQVMQQPAIAARAHALEERLHQRMLQVEPETDRMLTRGRELQTRLLRLQQGQAQGGARP